MSPKNKKFGLNKSNASKESSFERLQNTRVEKKVTEDLPKMVFSFKDFDINSIPPGQNYDNWQDDKLLAYMLKKFGDICGLNIVEAIQQNFLKIYDNFPTKTSFKQPQHIINEAKWAVIMNIKGQKGRVVGHIIDNVFYVVFLDQDHKFYISEKRNT